MTDCEYCHKEIKKVLVILGCLLFLFSLILPYYHFDWGNVGGNGSSQLWSYREDGWSMVGVGIVSHRFQDWFSDYWFINDIFISFEVACISISMFALQVLTLALGVAFIIFKRRILSFAPLLLSLAVIALMTWTGVILSGMQRVWGEYQLGYYLVYPSLAMFLLAFLLNEVTKNRQTTNREILNHTATEDKLTN